jgi:hypothetical protein
MKIDQWLVLLLILATFFGPVCAALIQNRQPREVEAGWIKRLNRSPWTFPVFLIVVALVSLATDLRDTAPLTRRAIFEIAFDVAGVFWGFFCMICVTFGEILRSVLNTIAALSRGQREITQEIIETLRLMATAPSEAIEEIRNTIESMSEEIEEIRQKSEARSLFRLFRP